MLQTVLRPQIAVISVYSILGRGCRLWAARWNTKFHKAAVPNWGRNQMDGLSQFHSEFSMLISFVDVSRGFGQQSDVKVAHRRHTFSDILHANCRHPTVEVLTLASPADKVFANGSSEPLLQYFIYFIGGPVSYS